MFIKIWRYANHVPLLDYAEDALSCCTSSAVRAVRWGDFGYKLRLSLDNNNTASPAEGVDGSGNCGPVKLHGTTNIFCSQYVFLILIYFR